MRGPASTCGKPLRKGDPRYRTAEGESHVRCHEGPRVLVVEDDSALLELIVGVVERVGYVTDHHRLGLDTKCASREDRRRRPA